MAYQAGTAFVQILPSLRGFQTKLTAELKAINPSVDMRVQPVLDRSSVRTLQAELSQLGARSPSVRVDADTTAAKADLAGVDAQQRRLNGQTAKVNVKVDGVAQSLIGIAALSRALGTLALPGAILAATPALVSLGASAVQASGALALLPAVGIAAGAAIGTVALGFQNLSDALGPTGTPAQLEKVNEALAKLAPAGRDLVGTLRGLGPAWTDLRLDVQQRLLDGVAGSVQRLGDTYLPILQTALGGVATGFNTAFQGTAAFFTAPAVALDLSRAMTAVTVGLQNASGAARPLAAAFTDIFAVGAQFLPGFGVGLADAAERFRQFIAAARGSGDLARWIREALDVLQQLGSIAVNVGAILGSMFAAAKASGDSFLTTLDNVTGRIAAALRTPEGAAGLQGFFTAIREVVSGLVDRLVSLWPAVVAGAGAFMALWRAAQPLLDVLFSLVTAVLPPLLNLIGFLAPVIVPLVAGFVAYSAAVQVITTVTKAWAAVQLILNGVLVANPIGLVVAALAALVAGLIYAWQNSETFRDIVTGAWDALRTAAVAVFGFIRDFITGVWNGIRTVVTTVWDSIAAFFNAAFSAYLAFFRFTWETVSSVFSAVWEGIRVAAVAVWNAISVFFTGAFDTFLTFFRFIWDAVRAHFEFIWTNNRTAATFIWNAISTFFTGAFNAYLAFFRFIWDGVRAHFEFIWTNNRDLAIRIWNSIRGFFGGAFSEFTGFFTTTWNNIRDAFGRAFGGVVDIARNIWNQVKLVFQGGINKVIDGVNWPVDKINGLFSIRIPRLPHVSLFAHGGPVRGPGTETSDSIPARLSRDEHVLTAREVRGMGGHEQVEEMRQAARKGVLRFYRDGGAVVPGFQGGGAVYQQLFNLVKRQFPQANLNSGLRRGDPGYHGRGKAVDLGQQGRSGGIGHPYLANMNRWIHDTYGKGTAQLIYTGLGDDRPDLFNRRPHNYGGATNAGHRNHVHWAVDSMGDLGSGGLLGAIGGAIGDFVGAIMPSFDGILDGAKGFMRGLGLSPSWLTDVGLGFLDKAWDGLKRKATDLWTSLFGGGDGAALGPATANQAAHVREIIAAAKERGLDRAAAKIGVATGLVESNIRILANPKVPASLNFPHEGLGYDHDSVGIFQQRQRGWGTLAQRMNARASAGLFFNKLKTFNWRAMDPGAAAQKVQVSAFPGKYATRMAQADRLVSAAGFDDGGVMPPGFGTYYNGTRKPEVVLTNEQWRAISSRAVGGDGTTIVNNWEIRSDNPVSVAETVRRRQAFDSRTR